MYYKSGPIGLVLTSIIVLGVFLGISDLTGFSGMLFLFIACVICPAVSKLIYVSFKAEQARQEYIREYMESLSNIKKNKVYMILKSDFLDRCKRIEPYEPELAKRLREDKMINILLEDLSLDLVTHNYDADTIDKKVNIVMLSRVLAIRDEMKKKGLKDKFNVDKYMNDAFVNDEDKIYQCVSCGYRFADEVKRCPNCNKIIEWDDVIEEEVEEQLDNEIYQCTYCNETFKNKPKRCPACNRIIDWDDVIDEQLEEYIYECTYCGHCFEGKHKKCPKCNRTIDWDNIEE